MFLLAQVGTCVGFFALCVPGPRYLFWTTSSPGRHRPWLAPPVADIFLRRAWNPNAPSTRSVVSKRTDGELPIAHRPQSRVYYGRESSRDSRRPERLPRQVQAATEKWVMENPIVLKPPRNWSKKPTMRPMRLFKIFTIQKIRRKLGS